MRDSVRSRWWVTAAKVRCVTLTNAARLPFNFQSGDAHQWELTGISCEFCRPETDEELLEDLYRVYRFIRERPVYDKHKLRGGRISPGTICHRFGSWDWACRRLKDFLRNHGHFNPEMPLPEELEKRVRSSSDQSK